MLVRHFCYYLTDWSGITPRKMDWDSNKVVKAVKNETINGYADIAVAGERIRLNDSNKQQFLNKLWAALGKSLGGALSAKTALVPVPNSKAIVGAPATYRTLKYAQAIAAASSGKVVAVDALRWIAEADAAHTQAGFRTPEPRYDNLSVIQTPELPVILFDDVITSGSSFIAACWRLEEVGTKPTEGHVVARRTAMQEERMFGVVERELEIPPRPML
jgi:hypothetical protein